MIDWYSRNLHSVLSPKREIFGEISKKRTRKRENRADKPERETRNNTQEMLEEMAEVATF